MIKYKVALALVSKHFHNVFATFTYCAKAKKVDWVLLVMTNLV